MPEGHTIHRYAAKHQAALGGKRVTATSPQGRFAAGAARIDSLRLDEVVAHGKHLFYRWEAGTTLHVHLGLFGRFRLFDQQPPPPPTDGTRLSLAAGDVTLYLSGPTACEIIDPGSEALLRDRLGPDPLASETDGDPCSEFGRALAGRRIPIGAALLDQRIIAGIGNVYRAEILFLAGIHPSVPAREVPPDSVTEIWDRSVSLLRAGAAAGRIVTVDPADLEGDTTAERDRETRLYVYHRFGQPCRRCRTPIERGVMANRKIWWCSSCQGR